MSVISFDEIHNGRDGEDQLSSDGKQISRYTRVFRAATNDATDEAATILIVAACPNVGALYPGDPRAYCQRVQPRNESFSKLVWIVTCSYSTERELAENPLDDPAKISWSTSQYTRPYFKHAAGPNKDEMIQNTAGYYFDPPVEGDDARWGANVQKNVAAVPGWIGQYKHAINDAAFTLDGYPVGVRMAKISGIDISEPQERNDIAFRVLSMRIDLNEDTWIKLVLNDGFYEVDPNDPTKRIQITDNLGSKTTESWPLDEDGHKITNPMPSNAICVDCYLYRELSFVDLPGCEPVPE